MNAQQLRNSILQQAIQGKLVPQDPADEPASVLLQRIRKEKERLVKEGKLKKKDLEGKPIEEGEIPFEIPKSWEWVRWGDLSESIQYGFNAPAKENGRIKMVRISDIQNGRIVWETVPFCEINEAEIGTYLLKKNDILFARTGGTVGKSYLVKDTPEEAIYAGYLIRTRYSNQLCPQYLKFFMESTLYWSQLKEGTIATAQPNCNGNTLSKMILPIPPLPEQRRIVAKIEELMPLVERYGKAQQALDQLNESLPARLRQSILQEAIQGRLVPQDPKEEPASELLKRIRKEKELLVKEGKLKKKDLESKPIEEDEIPFEIPESWEWVRLFEVCDYIHRGKSPTYSTEKILPVMAQKCNQWDRIYTDKCLFADKNTIDRYTEEHYLRVGDVIVNSTGGGTVGRTGYVDEYVFKEYPKFVADSHVTIVRSNAFVYGKYLYYFLISPFIQTGLEERCSGSTNQIELGTETIRNYRFPLPPLSEQKRIVAKIEELFGVIKEVK